MVRTTYPEPADVEPTTVNDLDSIRAEGDYLDRLDTLRADGGVDRGDGVRADGGVRAAASFAEPPKHDLVSTPTGVERRDAARKVRAFLRDTGRGPEVESVETSRLNPWVAVRFREAFYTEPHPPENHGLRVRGVRDDGTVLFAEVDA
jgi:hypothetical protein